ncbi:hypothetical protein EVAR_40887_1 [Eumeta japonica]|uniref:Uncharacterized protein n=1 Tax=Eumeta variegata TaxID=151549 RepID=A0A4C1X626_EUMVA|nr:hypothetical protein EVAR_40887_1 [Eumeta japonica]
MVSKAEIYHTAAFDAGVVSLSSHGRPERKWRPGANRDTDKVFVRSRLVRGPARWPIASVGNALRNSGSCDVWFVPPHWPSGCRRPLSVRCHRHDDDRNQRFNELGRGDTRVATATVWTDDPTGGRGPPVAAGGRGLFFVVLRRKAYAH